MNSFFILVVSNAKGEKKMSIKKIITAAAAGLMFATAAHAIETQCDKYSGTYDRTYCLSKLFVDSDAELNVVYKELRDLLNDSGKKALKNAEVKWLKYRTDRCETSPGTIDVRCSYEVNVDRTNYLRERARECRSSKCDNNAVGRQSW